jgi:hypothetical protein
MKDSTGIKMIFYGLGLYTAIAISYRLYFELDEKLNDYKYLKDEVKKEQKVLDSRETEYKLSEQKYYFIDDSLKTLAKKAYLAREDLYYKNNPRQFARLQKLYARLDTITKAGGHSVDLKTLGYSNEPNNWYWFVQPGSDDLYEDLYQQRVEKLTDYKGRENFILALRFLDRKFYSSDEENRSAYDTTMSKGGKLAEYLVEAEKVIEIFDEIGKINGKAESARNKFADEHARLFEVITSDRTGLVHEYRKRCDELLRRVDLQKKRVARAQDKVTKTHSLIKFIGNRSRKGDR